jgi:hypothetical protein
VPTPAGSGADPSLGEDPPDRSGTDPVAEPDQLTLDAAMPQPGFSRASRTTRSLTSSLMDGRPGRGGTSSAGRPGAGARPAASPR